MRLEGPALVAWSAWLLVGASSAQAPHSRVEELKAGNETLRQRLEALTEQDPLLGAVEKIGDSVVVAIRPALVERIVEEIALHYLDRVELNLAPDVHVHHGGVVSKKTFLGTVKGGEWTVDLRVKTVQAVLKARRPEVRFEEANRVDVSVPVAVEKGSGVAAFDFSWNATTLASLVCKDFRIAETLAGHLVPAEYTVAGGFTFTATPDAIVAVPRFPDQKFHVNVDLTPESWAKIQKALDEQDTFGKCGIALKPPEIMEKLRGLSQKGFDVKLPRSLLRQLSLPASVEQQVNVQDNIVQLSVKPGVLGVEKDALVFSSAVSTQITAMAIGLGPRARGPGKP